MRDYLNRLRMQFQRFMIGRYGMDQFGRFLSSLLLALIIFNFLIPAALPSRILWALEWIVLIILYARMFSKNINKRYQENEAFLRRQFYVSEWWKKWKFRFQESRKYHIYRCPNCKQHPPPEMRNRFYQKKLTKQGINSFTQAGCVAAGLFLPFFRVFFSVQ